MTKINNTLRDDECDAVVMAMEALECLDRHQGHEAEKSYEEDYDRAIKELIDSLKKSRPELF